MGFVVFNLIPTTFKSVYILFTIGIIRIKYGFMWATIQILDAALETLQTRKSKCHILVSYEAGFVANSNSVQNSNVLYPDKIMSKFTMIFHF